MGRGGKRELRRCNNGFSRFQGWMKSEAAFLKARLGYFGFIATNTMNNNNLFDPIFLPTQLNSSNTKPPSSATSIRKPSQLHPYIHSSMLNTSHPRPKSYASLNIIPIPLPFLSYLRYSLSLIRIPPPNPYIRIPSTPSHPYFIISSFCFSQLRGRHAYLTQAPPST